MKTTTTTTRATTYRTINVKPEVFAQLLKLAELLGTEYAKVNLGDLTGTLINRELQSITPKK